MTLQPIVSSVESLIDMSELNWITYLPSNRICEAVAHAFKANKYIGEVFGDAIESYNRDDFTVRDLPAMAIYEPTDRTRSRFFPMDGKLVINMYLPTTIARSETNRIFNTLTQAVVFIMQQEDFWFFINDFIVPTPSVSSPIYESVVKYKRENGSSLVNFGQDCDISIETLSDFASDESIGGCWKLQIKTNYLADLSNFYAMLEDFGINFSWDPNKIVYPALDDFAVNVIVE